MPRPRPPFPAVKGLWGKPTNINNVETLANVPLIVLKGSDWYRGIGTEGSKGTKIFALAGKVNNTGLVEVPMGTTLREIVFGVGGGIPNGRHFKAAQMGGPSGGCVPARYLDLPIDYDSVKEAGAIMGSGGMVVMDESICMVDIARFFTEFVKDESCGKCAPCRIGTQTDVRHPRSHHRGRGRAGGHRPARAAGQGRHRGVAVRARPDGGEPGPVDHPPLPRRVRGAHRREALRGELLQEDGGNQLRRGLPRPRQRAGVRGPHQGGPARRGAGDDPPPKPVPVRVRPRVRPPLRDVLPARRPGRGSRDPQPEALRERRGEGGRHAARLEGTAQGANRGDRRRTVRAHGGVLPVLDGPRGDRSREGRDDRRRAHHRHPRLPSATRRAGARCRVHPPRGRDDRDGPQGRLHPGAARRRLRLGVRGDRGAGERRARDSGRASGGSRGHAGVPPPGQLRHAGRGRRPGRRGRRRKRGHRRGAHGHPARGRVRHRALPPRPRGDAGAGRRGRGRDRGGRADALPVGAGLHRRQRPGGEGPLRGDEARGSRRAGPPPADTRAGQRELDRRRPRHRRHRAAAGPGTGRGIRGPRGRRPSVPGQPRDAALRRKRGVRGRRRRDRALDDHPGDRSGTARRAWRSTCSSAAPVSCLRNGFSQKPRGPANR